MDNDENTPGENGLIPILDRAKFDRLKEFLRYRFDCEVAEKIKSDPTLKSIGKQEREKIANAGYELVINNHTYYRRVQSMFNYIAFKFGGKYNKLRI